MKPRTMLMATLALAGMVLPVAAETMYGGGSGQQDGRFGIVDQITGDFSVLGDPTATTGQGLSGLAFGMEGRLWASVSQNSVLGSRLFEIDPVTGSLINDVGPIQTGAGADVRIVDLAMQPLTNVLFGLDRDGNLFTINKQTAVATLIGDPGVGHGGIAFSPSGTLYLVQNGGGELWIINPNTAATVGMSVDIESGACLDGLAVRPSDGALFATECDGREIIRINPINGDSEEIDPGDAEDDVADLAFQFAPVSKAPALSVVGSTVLAMALLLGGLWRGRQRAARATV